MMGRFTTSQQRFEMRKRRFAKDGKPLPSIRHFLWWTIHNVVAHPLLLLPINETFLFHDWTSDKLNHIQPLRDGEEW